MFEPRGHADMYGAIISSSSDADLDVFFTGVEPDVKVAADEALAVAQRLATEAVSKNRSNLAKGS